MRKLAVVLALCASMLMPSARATTYPARVLPDSLGMNAQFLVNVVAVTTQAQREAAVATIKQKGINVVRALAHWRFAEPNPPVLGVHQYSWTSADAWMRTLALAGVRAAPMLGGTPQWDSPGAGLPAYEKYAPIHPEYFAAFAGAFANRNKAGGAFWTAPANADLTPIPPNTYEIWNEENEPGNFTNVAGGSCPFHQVGTDPGPKVYADLYAPARAAIKAAQSTAVVIVGGLVGTTVPVTNDRCTIGEYLAGMKQHRPTIQIDGIGLHMYRNDHTNLNSVAELEAQMATMRQQIDALGWTVNIPIYLNENGWVTSGGGAMNVTETQRASNFSTLPDRLLRSNCGIRQYQPHTWLTPETDPTNAEHWYGIANFNGTTKQSADDYSTVVQTLQGNGPSAPNSAIVNMCPGRPDPDIDGDGYIDSADGYPADPTQH